MKRLVAILTVIFLMVSNLSYAFPPEETDLLIPGKGHQTQDVSNQKQQTQDKPRTFKTNSILAGYGESQSDSVGKKLFQALNLTLSVISIPFLFTGPTSNVLSNFALNYPLVHHVGETISSAVVGGSNPPTSDVKITYEVTKSKPLDVFVPARKECNWIAVEQSDKNLLEFKRKGEGMMLFGGYHSKSSIFIFQPLETGETVLHLGCINSSGEPLLTFTYKLKIVD